MGNAKMHVGQRFALNDQSRRTPYACTDKYGRVSVFEQVIDHKVTAHDHMRQNTDTYIIQSGLVSVQNGFGQTEIRDAILQHTANFILFLEDGDTISLLASWMATVSPAGSLPMTAAFLSLNDTFSMLMRSR